MIEKLIDSYNVIIGGVTALLFGLFGEYWFLFALFLFLNFMDWITGWMKARLLGTESSNEGLLGIIKKLGYWIMVALSFAISFGFVSMGEITNIDLSFMMGLGWFVISGLIVNETRSIVENFVEAGFNVPTVLMKGLEITEKMINKEEE